MFLNQRIRQYLICLVALVVVILYILSLAGCVSTSPGIPGLYLVRLVNNQTQAEVRIGLFGTCAGLGGNLTCAGTYGQNQSVAGDASQYVLPGASTTTANGTTQAAAPAALQSLLAIAAAVQSRQAAGAGGVVAVVFVPMILGCAFLLAAIGALAAHGAFTHGGGAGGGAGMGDGMGYGDDKFGGLSASGHQARSWALVGTLATYSAAAATGAATAATVAARALLFAGTALPGATLSAAQQKSSDTVVVRGGTALPVLAWFIVMLTLGWHVLMTFVWRKA